MPDDAEPPIDERVSAEDERAVLRGLLAFNEARIGPANELAVKLVARDAGGAVVGGLLGLTKWGWLYVDKLWVDESARGQRLGSRLLARAESIAMARGCVGAYLHTFEHQARAFYEKLGYTLFGTLDGYPAGTRQHYVFKRFSSTLRQEHA